MHTVVHALPRALPRPSAFAPTALFLSRPTSVATSARPSLCRVHCNLHSARATMATSPATLTAVAESVAGAQPTFAQTMLRVSDPDASISFYERLGLRYLTSLAFPEYSFSLYFLAATDDPTIPKKDSSRRDAALWLWSRPYPTLELTHNWPNEKEPAEKYVTGNDAPRGFGHLGLVGGTMKGDFTPNVVDADVPGEGAMCVRDPDGYAVKLVEDASDVVYARAMLRVTDPAKSVRFFERLGMQRLARVEGAETTHFFMGYAPDGEGAPEGNVEETVTWLKQFRGPVVHLRHEWKKSEALTNGNEKPNRGFGHLGILVDDIYDVAAKMEEFGYGVVRKPSPFLDVGAIAFVKDDDVGYWVELIQREGETPAEAYRKQ